MPGWHPEYQAGAQGVVAVLAAWLGRSAHPVGSVLEISTMEVLCSLHQWTTVYYSYTGVVRGRHGNRYERTHPIALLPCKDGWVGMAITTPVFWESFCKMVGHPEMITDPRLQSRWHRTVHADDIDEVTIPWLMERTAAEIFRESQEVYRLPIGPALRFPELLTDRHLRARGFWQEIDHPVAGRLSYPSSPFRLKELPPPEKPAPLLGRHNEEVYGSLLGLSKEEQTRLRQMGVI